MFRKILAVAVSLITLWAIKETIVIFTVTDVDIAKNSALLKLASLSITIPLAIASLLLWRPKQKEESNEQR